MTIFDKIKDKANDLIDEHIMGTITEPYKCRICKQWTKRKSKGKWICPECYKKLK